MSDAAGLGEGAARLAAAARRRLGPPPESPAWPPVSIVVLNRDGAARLRRLLAGLRERTDYPELELIVVDNASSDDSVDFLRRVEAPFPISILANAHNESFSDGCNQGAALASGELLLFLNNDAEPFEPGWLRELVACLERSAAGAVGPTLVEPAVDAEPIGYRVEQRGHRVGEEGGRLVPLYRDQGSEVLGDRLGEDVEVAAVAAACLLMTRRAFDEVGGFTHGYLYGGEDSDLCLKLHERGTGPVCSGRSLLIHPPNTTLNATEPLRRGEWARGNRRLFMERWGPRIRREYELDRLRGGGIWAAPAASPPGPTRAAVEALGFCLKSAVPEREATAGPSLDEVAAALRRRGRRAAILRGEDVDALAGFDYDVVVHLARCGRFAPRPAQINLLWADAESAGADVAERSRYDLVLDGGPGPEAAGRRADRLIEAGESLARHRRYRRRIRPER